MIWHPAPQEERAATVRLQKWIEPETLRTQLLFKIAGKLRAEGVPHESILATLRGLNSTFAPPHVDEKLQQIAHDIQEYPLGATEGYVGAGNASAKLRAKVRVRNGGHIGCTRCV